MRLSLLGLASGLCLVSFPGLAAHPPTQRLRVFARLPLRFEAVDAHKWVAHGPGFGVGFSPDGTFIQLGDRGLKLTFEGREARGNKGGHFEGLDKSAVPTNYFGRKFRSVDAFGRLRQTGVYPGIDIVYYGKGQSLEYDFELAPGADPSRIRMRFEGADTIHLGPQGQVILALGDRAGDAESSRGLSAPRVRRNRRRAVFLRDGSGRLHRHSPGRLRRRARRWWWIPPSCSPAYLAGTSADVPIGIGHDKNGSIYIAGYTYSPDFPLVGTAYTGFFTQHEPAGLHHGDESAGARTAMSSPTRDSSAAISAIT